jgi:hypothetical protein
MLDHVWEVPITVAYATPLAWQEILFQGYIRKALFKNDSPHEVIILSNSDNVCIAHLAPYQSMTYSFGNRNFNCLRVYGDNVSTASEILAHQVLFVYFQLKRSGED